jgi:hypothetical protein
LELSLKCLEQSLGRLAGVGMLIAGLAACHGASDPAETGARMVAGTEGIDCGDHQPMSYSPDGRWLAFWLWTNRAENAPPEHRLALVNLDTGQRHLPRPGAHHADKGEESPAPRIDKLCWTADSQRLLTGVLPPGREPAPTVRPPSATLAMRAPGHAESPVVHAIDLDHPDHFLTANINECGTSDTGHWRYQATQLDDPTRLGAVDVEAVDRRRLRLKLPDGQTLAEHRPVRASTRSISIPDHAWSPDQASLAYVVHEHRGAWGGLSHAWLSAPGADSVQLLTGPVYAMAWRNNQELHLCLPRPGQTDSALFSWRVDEVSSR